MENGMIKTNSFDRIAASGKRRHGLLKTLVLSLFLTLTSFGCTTLGTKAKTSTFHLPSKFATLCPEDLPDAASGSAQDIQLNHKAQQRQYHDCAQIHNGAIKELRKQGAIN